MPVHHQFFTNCDLVKRDFHELSILQDLNFEYVIDTTSGKRISPAEMLEVMRAESVQTSQKLRIPKDGTKNANAQRLMSRIRIWGNLIFLAVFSLIPCALAMLKMKGEREIAASLKIIYIQQESVPNTFQAVFTTRYLCYCCGKMLRHLKKSTGSTEILGCPLAWNNLLKSHFHIDKSFT